MKCLLITTIPPHPTNRGGNQRTALLHRALAELGDVDLACLYPPERVSDAEREVLEHRYGMRWLGALREPIDHLPWRWLRALGASRVATRLAHNTVPQRRVYAPSADFGAWLDSALREGRHDLIVCRYSRSLAAAVLPDGMPCLLDVDDLDTQKYASRLGQSLRSPLATLATRRHLRALNALLPPLFERADRLWVTNVDDLAAVADLSTTPCEVLPNIPFPHESAPDSRPRKTITSTSRVDVGPIVLAVCSMRMGANERGIDRFVKEVWPRIRTSVPDAEFRIAGSAMTATQIERWSAVPGVRPLGTVEDLAATYADAAFSVTPVSEGGGSKIKVAESLEFGRTCVITRHALRGYETLLGNDESLLVADDDDEFVAACVRLLREPQTRARLAERGRRAVRDHLSENAFRRVVHRGVRAVMDESGRAGPSS